MKAASRCFIVALDTTACVPLDCLAHAIESVVAIELFVTRSKHNLTTSVWEVVGYCDIELAVAKKK